jgi:F-type H+-transporting ATPase subunit alpha
VGGRAQLPAYREVAGDLRLTYSQFQELETFARFGTRLDERTRQTLVHGRRIREVLLQDRFAPLSPAQQLAVLLAATRGLLDPVPLEQMATAQEALLAALEARPDLADDLLGAGDAEPRGLESLLAVLREALAPFAAAEASGATGSDEA